MTTTSIKHTASLVFHQSSGEEISPTSFSGKEELIALLSTMTPQSEIKDRDILERIQKNSVLLHTRDTESLRAVVTWGKDLEKLLQSRHLPDAVELLDYFEIKDGRVLAELVERRDGAHQGFLSEAVFSHFIDLKGKEALCELFMHTTDTDILAQRYALLDACTHQSFRSASYFHIGNFYLSSDAPPHSTKKKITLASHTDKPVCYIGGYGSEISYLKETCNIPLEELLTLDKDTLGQLCGTLRSLSNEALGLQDRHEEIVDFSVSKKPVNVALDQVCSLQPILKLMYGHMAIDEHVIYTDALERVTAFFTFLRTQSNLPNLPRLVTIDPGELRNILLQKTKQQLKKRQTQRAHNYAQWAKENRQYIRKKHRLGRNYAIITSLAQTLGMPDLLAGSKAHNKQISSTLPLLRMYHQQIHHLAQKYAGLYSIGGKIHFPSAIPQEKIDAFKRTHKLDATHFKLLHANTSINLPPCYFPEELLFMINCMEEAGLIDNDPQLQIGIPGRLPNHLGAVLGSSMILLSEQHVSYTPESFGTTHDSATGRRMVVYDAGVYDNAFTRNSKNITGRTDVLLLKDVNLIPKAQVIGSLLSQTEYDGWFAQLGSEFIRDYLSLIEKHHMLWTVQGPWIYDATTANDQEALLHFKQVQALTERQKDDFLIYNHTQQKKGLMVFELRNLLTTYRERIQRIQSHFSNQ